MPLLKGESQLDPLLERERPREQKDLDFISPL